MSDETKTTDFLALYASSQRRIYAYIRTHVLTPTDADDVFQDTVAVLWQKFSEFQNGTDFVRWACCVARLEVLAHHRHRKRLLSVFSDEVIDLVAEKVLELGKDAADRAEALRDCEESLPSRDRAILDLRYRSALPVKQIAIALHRTESTIYKLLAQVHNQLYDCVETKLARIRLNS
jgi:RNA polymerase sigma-70 factor, ECF subfamily